MVSQIDAVFTKVAAEDFEAGPNESEVHIFIGTSNLSEGVCFCSEVEL